jgi:hypothetical protein
MDWQFHHCLGLHNYMCHVIIMIVSLQDGRNESLLGILLLLFLYLLLDVSILYYLQNMNSSVLNV